MSIHISHFKDVFDKLFRDKEGRVAVLQLPNPALMLWGVATLASHLLPTDWRTASGLVASVAIIIWSAMEIHAGSSLFRRLLGAVVLAVVLAGKL